jgi:drug/metabolite transporter (DMT)-like permease
MTKHPYFGVFLALFGVLVLTPDALLMRLSGMDAMQMIAWRGLLGGSMFLLIWAVASGRRIGADVVSMATLPGIVIVVCHGLNGVLFSTGIAIAPVSVVLFGVAATPIFSTLFSRLIIGEVAGRATWIATGFVMAGIAVAVFGGASAPRMEFNALILGAACGLGVGAMLAMTFVLLRHYRKTPLLLAIGMGAFLGGAIGFGVTGPARMTDGSVWAIAVTGIAILPLSFFSLTLASRHTAAPNVSLIMLLETVLAPLWVWYGIGEAPTHAMLIGGAIVVVTLIVYLRRLRANRE